MRKIMEKIPIKLHRVNFRMPTLFFQSTTEDLIVRLFQLQLSDNNIKNHLLQQEEVICLQLLFYRNYLFVVGS
jgi:hypothetical protein